MDININKVIDFWFKELEPKQWWKKDSAIDDMIRQRFGELHKQASLGELFEWRESPLGSLAEIIILDQFSRNIYRDHPKAFATDSLALALSQVAIAKRFDNNFSQNEKHFLYIPFMHSESKRIHEIAVDLFTSLAKPDVLKYEYKHKVIIDRFGRYPHRNKILGRKSTDEEEAFLTQPNSSF